MRDGIRPRWPLIDGQARRAAQRHRRTLVAFPGRVALQFRIIQDGGRTCIRPVKNGLPLGPSLALERVFEEGSHGGPFVKVEALLLQAVAMAAEAHSLDEDLEELRFQRADGEVLAVFGLVGVVVGTPAVEQVVAAAAGTQAGLEAESRKGGQVCRAVDHVGLDDLAPAGGLASQEGEEDALEEVGAAACEVGEDVGRRMRRLVGAAEEAEGPRDGDVVDVVAGHGGVAPVAAEAREASVDEARVDLEELGGPEAEFLEDAGPEGVDEDVGGALGHELFDKGHAGGGLDSKRWRPCDG